MVTTGCVLFAGLFFNKGADSCDYARNVVCKKKPSTSTSTTTKAPVTSTARSTTKLIPSTTTTTTTTTTTPEPVIEEEEYDDEEYDDEVSEAEDPRVIKELIDLIKKLGMILYILWFLESRYKLGLTYSMVPEIPYKCVLNFMVPEIPYKFVC